MRIVATIGGRALLRRGDKADLGALRAHVEAAAKGLAQIAREHELVVSFGHGPQVAITYDGHIGDELPLDLKSAMIGGGVGYLLEQALQNELDAETTAFVPTHTLVSADDEAFAAPLTPTGERNGHRVACPEAVKVLQIRAIEALLNAGIAVIASPAGGIPVALDASGRRVGVEAIVDRDLVAALLAQSLDADLFVVLGNIRSIDLDWGTWATRPLRETTPAALRSVLHEFAQGTVSPMIDAACRFVEKTGRRAAIGAFSEAAAVAEGRAGTQVLPDHRPAAHAFEAVSG